MWGLVGCGNKSNQEEPKKEEKKAKCEISECVSLMEVTNTVDEINETIGFEGEKDSDYSDDYTWKFDDKNYITLKSFPDSHIIQATIDKEAIKNKNLNFPTASELKEKLNNVSLAYEELVEWVGGEGALAGKTSKSVSYVWVNSYDMRLRAIISNKTRKCSIASFS